MKLRELAHARAGDKGNVSNLALFAYETGDYAYLCRACDGGAREGALRRHRWR